MLACIALSNSTSHINLLHITQTGGLWLTYMYKDNDTESGRLAGAGNICTGHKITVNVRLSLRGVQLISNQNPWEEMDQ